jgi:hypothetical protein
VEGAAGVDGYPIAQFERPEAGMPEVTVRWLWQPGAFDGRYR